MKKFLAILVLGLLVSNYTSQAKSYDHKITERYICHDTHRKGFFTTIHGNGWLKIHESKKYGITLEIEYQGLYNVNSELSTESILVHVNTNEDFTTMIKFNKNTLEGFISEVPVNQDYKYFIRFKCN